VSWSEPVPLFAGHDARNQPIRLWREQSAPDHTDHVLEIGANGAIHLPSLSPGFVSELKQSLRRGAA
jgi:hypothetical protein